MLTLNELSRRLASGAVSARSLVDQSLARIMDPRGEGARAFISVSSESARAQADEVDRRRAAGQALPAFAGIPLAIKDLFDVAGEVTRAGSRILADRPPADRDAPVIARLRAAGFIFIGRTNMTEFAYSGVGLNPYYGTPLSCFDRATRRIPGGSTSGGGVAVADDMAAASLGTDTGGSCRIPAAFNGIVGFKPTASRVPRDGVYPLSQTLDSVGPLARSTACCATLDAILRGVDPQPLPDVPLNRIRLLLPTTLVLDAMDEVVGRAFERAVETLARAGVTIDRQPLDELQRLPQINAGGGLAAAEAYAWHRTLLEQHADRYDPRVAMRILKGRDVNANEVREARAAVIESVNRSTREFDALVMPTVPIIPPPLAAFEQDADYIRLNALVLRNPSLANFLDRCSISLPIHRPGEAPVGLMLIGQHDQDDRLFGVAGAIESGLVHRT
ncbi:MAG TPA: amidase [Steroidobacteraceae bacterium]|jgi:aspartyl-tRNA(Asn)/glutamyl-tRNA(Gln) amidotransferase subunit A|nr:amidase [Steroidobacteraceae bacterium]